MPKQVKEAPKAPAWYFRDKSTEVVLKFDFEHDVVGMRAHRGYEEVSEQDFADYQEAHKAAVEADIREQERQAAEAARAANTPDEGV